MKTDGGLLDGGDHKDTYNHNLLQELANKEQAEEAKKEVQKIKDTKKWIGIEKMKETKLEKKKEAEAKAAATASSSAEKDQDAAAAGSSAADVGPGGSTAAASSSAEVGPVAPVAGP